MAFEPWQLGLIDEAGYNGIRRDHFERVARVIERLPQDVIDTDAFHKACYHAGVNPNIFSQRDLDELQDRLNQE